MKCEVPSKEEVINMMRYGTPLFKTIARTQEEIVDRITSVAEYIQEPKKEEVDPETGERKRVRIFREAKFFKSPSQEASDQTFNKGKSKEDIAAQNADEYNIRSRESGVFLHDVLYHMVDFYHRKKKFPPKKILSENNPGFRMPDSALSELWEGAKGVVDLLQEHQNKIDPEGKMKLLQEIPMVNPARLMSGKPDLFAVFSDGSVILVDFKTLTKNSDSFNKNTKEYIDDSVFYHSKNDQYHLQTRDYVDIAEAYGINNITKIMLIPVVTKFKGVYAKKGEKRQLGRQYERIVMFNPKKRSEENKRVMPRYTHGSTTGMQGLDNMIDRMVTEMETLDAAIEKEKNSEARKKLVEKKRSLDTQFQNIVHDSDYAVMYKSVLDTYNDLKEEIEKDSLDNDRIQELLHFFNFYKDVSYILDDDFLKRVDEKVHEKAKTALAEISYLSISALEVLQSQIMVKNIKKGYIKESDLEGDQFENRFRPDFWTRTFAAVKQVDLPIFKVVKRIFEEKNEKHRQFLEKVGKEVNEKQWNAQTALKRLGLPNSMNSLVNRMVNPETGNLWAMRRKELYETVQAIEKKENEGERARDMKELFQIKDKQEYNTWYKREKARKERLIRKQLREGGYQVTQRAVDSRLSKWEKKHDLTQSSAWAQTGKNAWVRRKFTELKPEYVERYKTDEYREIEKIPELKEYFDYLIEMNEYFRDELGVDYGRLPNNFVPEIRSSIAEMLRRNPGMGLMEVMRQLKYRPEEDVEHNYYDTSSGERKSMPIFFLTGTLSKEEIAAGAKSMDLSASLLIMANMVGNYKFAKEYESAALNMAYLQGLYDNNNYIRKNGKNRRGDRKDRTLNIGALTDRDMKTVLDNYIDREVYGIYNKKVMGPQTEKVLSKAMTLTSLNFLGLSVMGFASGIAGYFQHRSVLKRYTTAEAFKEATRDFINENKKVTAMSKKFDLYQETMFDKMLVKTRSSTFDKALDTRNAYYTFRASDEKSVEVDAVALARSYGIDENNNLKRIENLPEGTPTLWSLIEMDDNGEISVKGYEMGDIRPKFRELVQHVAYKATGIAASDNPAHFQNYTILRALMQFKNFMPGVISERGSDIKYEEATDTLTIGRYRAAFAGMSTYMSVAKRTAEEQEQEFQFLKEGLPLVLEKIKVLTRNFVGMYNIVEGSMSEQLLDLKYQSLPESTKKALRKGGTDEQGKAELHKLVEQQARALAYELRMVASVILGSILLGIDYDGDDDPLWKDNPIAKELKRIIEKVELELMFTFNPFEVLSISKGGAAVLSTAVTATKVITNGLEELTEVITGVEDPGDRTPFLYYLFKLIPGLRSLRRHFPIFDGDGELIEYGFI